MQKWAAITVVAILGVLLAAAGLYWYDLSVRSQAPAQPLSVLATNQQMVQADPNFAAALQDELNGDYASAVLKLRGITVPTAGRYQDLTVLIHLERDEEALGHLTSAIQILQQIIGSTSYGATARAFAVEELGRMYTEQPSRAVAGAIFSQPPFKSLYVASSTNQSARNLFLYATGIYPLPLSEYSIANTYAVSIHYIGSTTTPAAIQMMKRLKDSVAAGDASLATIGADPPTVSYVQSAQLARAEVLGKVEQLGDTTLGKAENAFQTLLDSYASSRSTWDGKVRLEYAFFLTAMYGKPDANEITALLAPIYTDASHRGTLVIPYLKSFIGAPTSVPKGTLAAVAAMDKPFKDFLISTGWKDTDLTASIPGGGQ